MYEITIKLKSNGKDALKHFAYHERRTIQDQAAVIIENELERLGWMKDGQAIIGTPPKAERIDAA